MGNHITRRIRTIPRRRKKRKILILGLDGAGKTTILHMMSYGIFVPSIPTIGFNVEEVIFKNFNFTVWDIGGQDKIRCLWTSYLGNTEALIFVIDSTDRERIVDNEDNDTVRNELWKLVGREELKKSKILILANKQDLPNALTTAEIVDLLNLGSLRDHDWCVLPSCAKTGRGLAEGFDWIRESK